MAWKNFGDVDFWQHGILVSRHWEDREDEYDILRCDPNSDGEDYQVSHLYVDITDTWFQDKLDWVADQCDCKVRDFANEDEKILFAIALTDTFSYSNFQPDYPQDSYWVTKDVAYEWLQGYEVGDLTL